MTIRGAERAGVEGFRSGKGKDPYLNKRFLKAVSKDEGGVGEGTCMEAYAQGWVVASLAQGDVRWSVARLAEITA